MKKIIIFILSLASGLTTNAQDITDAVRYSYTSIEGSARFRALSGAFGALGGDLSAINVNPAGSAVFNTSFASFSLNSQAKKNKVSYFNNSSTRKDLHLDFNQAGAIFLFKNNNLESQFKKFTLSVAYDKLNNFSDSWTASGINPNNSIGNYFLNTAQGLRLDQISALPGESVREAYIGIGNAFGLQHQQAFLGYNSFIVQPIDETNDANTVYSSNISGGNYDQENRLSSNGYNGKLAFNFATQYNDKVYIGLNLNSHFLNFERKTVFYERNNNSSSIVKEVLFENTLRTLGSGFSFQLGTIIKVTSSLRAGLSYESPTWYRMEDETTQYIETLRDQSGSLQIQQTDPNVVNLFPEYHLQTPSKITGSLAYIFGKSGLLSVDYGIKNYSNIKFKPKDDNYFSEQNSIIENNLQTAATLNIGGEYKYKLASFRAGYRYEESPYKSKDLMSDLTGYSLGIGYKFGNTSLDLTYATSQQDRKSNFFNTGLTDAAKIDTRNSNFTLTLGYSL
jgi:hypothetical protein